MLVESLICEFGASITPVSKEIILYHRVLLTVKDQFLERSKEDDEDRGTRSAYVCIGCSLDRGCRSAFGSTPGASDIREGRT
ncbi:hypothetical protein COMA1_10537 [Candidatus Nitrospira nitrosa]|uniref:Uncharacterized protein n=1 Tax=Candidatus Nitrospira nitrosa TaxID=1742972 RepID=A0A0S4L6R8_9BACT|nr:hypothetical protein COMA1_10537 [Candidatus Nitrospira nitrosa]